MHANSECLDSSFWQKPVQFCVPTVLFERCSRVSLVSQETWKNTDESIAFERKKKSLGDFFQERKKIRRDCSHSLMKSLDQWFNHFLICLSNRKTSWAAISWHIFKNMVKVMLHLLRKLISETVSKISIKFVSRKVRHNCSVLHCPI